MPHAPVDHVARALSWGLLAAPEWDRDGLVAASARTLGRRHRWLPRIVEPVLAGYHRPPIDRPDELTRFLLAATPLAEIMTRARQQRRPVRVRTIATIPGGMGVRRWPVPEVAGLPALAALLEIPPEQLTWAADPAGRQRRTAPGPYHLYRYRWLTRDSAVPRLLEAPTPLLRAVLRRLHDRILCWVPVHPAVHGFVPGRSAVSHADLHTGTRSVVCLDLQTFFASISATRVNGLFRSMGYPEGVAWTLTGLCTNQTPVRILGAMPPGGDSSARHRLRAWLRGRHLPQGAPTSPALANLACFGLDRRLAGLAAAEDLTYSRYADDLTFSGDDVRSPRLVQAVTTIVGEEGFRLNPIKTRVRHAGQRQAVTGLVVNQKVSVSRTYTDQLRAVLHDALRNGPDVANRAGHPNFRAHLDGRVGWVESVSPTRGRRLREQFDAVAWPDAAADPAGPWATSRP